MISKIPLEIGCENSPGIPSKVFPGFPSIELIINQTVSFGILQRNPKIARQKQQGRKIKSFSEIHAALSTEFYFRQFLQEFLLEFNQKFLLGYLQEFLVEFIHVHGLLY